MKNKIITINVSGEYTLENHNVNANDSGRPKEAFEQSYISGQKIRYMIAEKMKDILSENGINTEISTGDSKTGDIINDVGSDLFGFMNTESRTETESGSSAKRISPIKVAFAFAKEKSNYFDDLFVRFSNNETVDNQNKQRINSKYFSRKDIMDVNSQLYIDNVGREKQYTITNKKFVEENNKLLYSADEKIKRINLFLQTKGELVGLANYSRNATKNTPDKVFISFSENRQFIPWFRMSEQERENYKKINKNCFYGDNNTEFSVDDAYNAAIKFLNDNISDLYI